MAFTVRKTTHRPWPVSITLLESDAAGNVQEVVNTFVGHFSPFTEDEFDAAYKAAKALYPVPDNADDAGESRTEKTDESTPIKIVLQRNAAIFAEVMVGWGPEVRDEQGQSIPFSTAALTALVTGPDGLAVSKGINAAINQFRFGYAPAKNALTSPVPGPTPGADEAAPTN